MNFCKLCLSVLIYSFYIQLWSTIEACNYLAKTEKSFNALVYSLFQDGTLPPGDVLDVGAHDGSWSCMYACFDTNRTVHAVDPSAKMLHHMSCPHPNMIKHNYAISNTTGYLTFSDHGSQFVGKIEIAQKGDVEIQTLDNLFLDIWKTIPGFLHIDVEGYELDVLLGGTKVIQQYKPVFTVEIHVVENMNFTVSLLEHIETLHYSIYMINEICGMRGDCRNFICFSLESQEETALRVQQHQHPNHHLHHANAHNRHQQQIIRPTLDIGLRHNGVIKVTSKNIFKKFEAHSKTAVLWQETDTFTHNSIADRK